MLNKLEEMPPQPTPKPFESSLVWPSEIVDAETANQACLLFAISQRRIERAKLRIENEKKLIKEEQEQLDELGMRYKKALEAYTIQNLPRKRDGSFARKTLPMKDADLSLRAHSGMIDIKDNKAAIEWAKENCPEAVKLDPRLVKEPLVEYVKANGEVPEGCEFVAPGDSFSIGGGGIEA